MLRTTQDILELRHWAEAHGARPIREDSTGRLAIAVPGGGAAGAWEVGWEEFEPAFVTTRSVFVYDDAPGCCRCFVGSTEEAHAYVREGCGAAAESAGASP